MLVLFIENQVFFVNLFKTVFFCLSKKVQFCTVQYYLNYGMHVDNFKSHCGHTVATSIIHVTTYTFAQLRDFEGRNIIFDRVILPSTNFQFYENG